MARTIAAMRLVAKRIDAALGAQVRVGTGLEIIVLMLAMWRAVLTRRTITARLVRLGLTTPRAVSRALVWSWAGALATVFTAACRAVALAVASHMAIGPWGA